MIISSENKYTNLATFRGPLARIERTLVWKYCITVRCQCTVLSDHYPTQPASYNCQAKAKVMSVNQAAAWKEKLTLSG